MPLVVSGAGMEHLLQIYLRLAERRPAYQAQARRVICPAMVF